MARILIIDDSPVARLLGRAVFEAEGHEVLEAEDGESGIETALSNQLDCVFLDRQMPGVSGEGVLKALQQESYAAPIVLVTADVDQQTRDECMKLGAALVIEKPRATDELLKALERVV